MWMIIVPLLTHGGSTASTRRVHDKARICVTLAHAHTRGGLCARYFPRRIVRCHVIHCGSKWALVKMAAYVSPHMFVCGGGVFK